MRSTINMCGSTVFSRLGADKLLLLPRMPTNSVKLTTGSRICVSPGARNFATNEAKVKDLATENRHVNISEMKRLLRSHGVQIQEGQACFKTSGLKLCLDQHRSKNPSNCSVFVNKVTGYFECSYCESSGPWNALEQLLHLKKDSSKLTMRDLKNLGIANNSATPSKVKEKLEGSISIFSVLTSDSSSLAPGVQQLLAKLELEKVKLSVMKQLGVMVSGDGSSLLFPLRAYRTGVLRGLKVLSCGPDGSEEEVTIPATGCQGMFGWPKGGGGKEEAVLVASVKDTLAVASSIPGVQPLCLPYGSSYLPQGLLPSLEPFSKITLWFGRNANGLWDDPRLHARKLGEERCYFVRPTEGQPAAWEGMMGGVGLTKLMSEARLIAHPSITTFESLKEDVLAEIQNVEKVKGVKWKRFPALNRILHGHRRGELTILTGPTGSGKTTFMSEYSLDLCLQGVSTLWGSFEIRNTRLARTMLQQLCGHPLDGMSEESFETWATQLSQLPLYFMTFHGQQSLKVVMETVSHAAYVHDISHVVIDNVQFMLGMGEAESHWSANGGSGVSDRFWRQDLVIAAFRKFATTADCHVTLVIHPRKERESDDLTSSSIFGGVKASQEADNILIIQDKRLSSVRGKKYLQVAKNRYSGDLGVMTLEFDKEALSYGKQRRGGGEGEVRHAAIGLEDDDSPRTTIID
ncbi:mitochondrial DNA helicase [Ischnura elegans]|uniref:mitochondrial DNA helicase n=1 Tax=Ischnura elegans TaxID=197161 RepID=UPI001ED8A079|nr:mitochondrial DNA helicase [Ischnura elegans]